MTIDVDNASSANGFVSRITLTNSSGASVALSSMGAGIVAVNTPNRNGRRGNIVADYTPHNGAVIWDYLIVGDDEVLFNSNSRQHDGRSHQISYRWTEENVLEAYFRHAVPDDILGQSFFNLDGSQEALADEYLWINSSEHPDFSTATQLRERLVGNDVFVHRWQLRDWQRDVMNDASLLASHLSGRQLSIHTSFPTLRIEIPSSRTGVAFSTLPEATLPTPQTTFLHFSLIP